eukprot:GHVQ01003549.1.p1 GENE.GHVQ01003549.1~~GHVQ01003549.1.p1  ORF type:complete len:300 (+),score=53.02 GHVQ01003549.1:245-1144(+)
MCRVDRATCLLILFVMSDDRSRIILPNDPSAATHVCRRKQVSSRGTLPPFFSTHDRLCKSLPSNTAGEQTVFKSQTWTEEEEKQTVCLDTEPQEHHQHVDSESSEEFFTQPQTRRPPTQDDENQTEDDARRMDREMSELLCLLDRRGDKLSSLVQLDDEIETEQRNIKMKLLIALRERNEHLTKLRSIETLCDYYSLKCQEELHDQQLANVDRGRDRTNQEQVILRDSRQTNKDICDKITIRHTTTVDETKNEVPRGVEETLLRALKVVLRDYRSYNPLIRNERNTCPSSSQRRGEYSD